MKNRYLFVLDLIITYVTFIMMAFFVFPVADLGGFIVGNIYLMTATAAIYNTVMAGYKIYATDWVYASMKEYIGLGIACITAAFINTVIAFFVTTPYMYPKLCGATNVCICVLICALRLAMRGIRSTSMLMMNKKEKSVLVIGAGQLAVMLLRDIWSNAGLSYKVVGLIDDDPHKMNTRVCGVNVIGTRDDILHICHAKKVDEIIFAIYTITPKDKAEILETCSMTGCKVSILPGVEESLYGMNQLKQVREIEIDDLLEREPILLDNDLIEHNIKNKIVLVTGGGGSIGSELCRQILKYEPEKLVIFDVYENSTFELQRELAEMFPEQKPEVLIGTVRDIERLEAVFEKYRPDIVFHAAAHKHVPLMEYSPAEAIKNNVFGTYNTALCAEKYGTKSFVFISTDKAVNPTNVMGASKRICEMIVQAMNKNGKTKFVAVRFGNVLGSNGSVIPIFKKQIKAGGPVTVTHPEITRFFMTIPEAVQLVLQAASYANGGEIFVLDMGKPVKIRDLAAKMISLSGYRPDVDIKIEFTGLRPGEKLYEELLMNEEGLEGTVHKKIFVGKPGDMEVAEMEAMLSKLKGVLDSDAETVKAAIAEVVPTYNYQGDKKTLEV